MDLLAAVDALWIGLFVWHLLARLTARYEATRLLIGILVFCIVGFHKAAAFPVVASPEYRSATVIDGSDGIQSFDVAYEKSARPILQLVGFPLGITLIIVGYGELTRRR